MVYVLSGIETINKGAELMLYAILSEIEHRDSDAIVYLPTARIPGGLSSVHSRLCLRELPFHKIAYWIAKLRITGALNRVGLWSDFLNEVISVKDADYFLDAGGLLFTDQVSFTKPMIRYWNKILYNYNAQGSKIVFLPQAFGPLQNKATIDAVSSLDKYADLIMARDKVSADYLHQVLKNPEKLLLFRDFTTSVKGALKEELKKYAGGVCIIPNYQMIRKAIIGRDDYIAYLYGLASSLKHSGYNVFFLDHENDATKLMSDALIAENFDVIMGLNALEIKGLIGITSLCISSRFHGAVSALNCAVPCLVTSWNHKYQELLDGFGQNDCVLPIHDLSASIDMALSMLKEPNYSARVASLKMQLSALEKENEQMWEQVWKLK